MDSAADARWYEIQVLPPSVDLQITDAKRATNCTLRGPDQLDALWTRFWIVR